MSLLLIISVNVVLISQSSQNNCDFANNDCQLIPVHCLNCTLNRNCIYGKRYNASCQPRPDTKCSKSGDINKSWTCRYCYQTAARDHACVKKSRCIKSHSVKSFYVTNCSVSDNVLCLGARRFHKMLPCNWTEGKSWLTAFCLSLFFGGFGADRFYLGMWQMGLGKLFTFGGLGVWTFVDWILIAFGYLKPSDGSVFV